MGEGELVVNAKQKREYALFAKLQDLHGYTLMPPRRGVDETMMVFDRRTNKMDVALVLRLAVPQDSALGEAYEEYRKEPTTQKKKRRRSKKP